MTAETDRELALSIVREIAQDETASTDERLQAASMLMYGSGEPFDPPAPDWGLAADELADEIAKRLKASA